MFINTTADVTLSIEIVTSLLFIFYSENTILQWQNAVLFQNEFLIKFYLLEIISSMIHVYRYVIVCMFQCFTSILESSIHFLKFVDLWYMTVFESSKNVVSLLFSFLVTTTWTFSITAKGYTAVVIKEEKKYKLFTCLIIARLNSLICLEFKRKSLNIIISCIDIFEWVSLC